MPEKFNFKDEDIDPEMLEIVKNFNRAGVETMFCCQGHFKVASNGDEGLCLPYLVTRLPNDITTLNKIILSHSKYPMINIAISHQFDYTPEIEEFNDYDSYVKTIDSSLAKCENTIIDFRINSAIYNLPENLYADEESHEEIFEYLRKKYINELYDLSILLLRKDIAYGTIECTCHS